MFQRARGRIADGAQSSFGTAPFRLQRDKTQKDLPVTTLERSNVVTGARAHKTVTRPSVRTNARMATPTTLRDTVCTGTHGGGVVVCVVAWCIPIAAVPPDRLTPLSHEGCKDKEGNCNILHHSLPFACICAVTRFCILALAALSRPFGAAFQSLSFSRSSFNRSTQLARHTYGRGTQLSLCCIGFGSPQRLGERNRREEHTSAAAAARGQRRSNTTRSAGGAATSGRTAAISTQHNRHTHTYTRG
jgi:hypothetical protein